MEDNHIVDTVQELRLEGVLQLAEDLVFHRVIFVLVGFRLVFRLLEAHLCFPIEQGSTDVRGHDDNGVAEVYRASLGVGQLAIFQNLEQHVEDIGVSLFDFVEQDHAIGLTAYSLGKLTTFFITNISRRGTDEPSRRVSFHEL